MTLAIIGYHSRAMDVSQIRKQNLELLVRQFRQAKEAAGEEYRQKDAAEFYGLSEKHLSQMLSAKTKMPMGHAVARRIEKRHKPPLPPGWMDQDHSENHVPLTPRQQSLRKIMDQLVRSDPDAIEQLLMQYLSNSRKKK